MESTSPLANQMVNFMTGIEFEHVKLPRQDGYPCVTDTLYFLGVRLKRFEYIYILCIKICRLLPLPIDILAQKRK